MDFALDFWKVKVFYGLEATEVVFIVMTEHLLQTSQKMMTKEEIVAYFKKIRAESHIKPKV